MTRYVRINAGPVWHLVRDNSKLVGWSTREVTECGRVLFPAHAVVDDVDGAARGTLDGAAVCAECRRRAAP